MDFEQSRLRVVRSLLPDGSAKATKTDSGVRTVPLLPALATELLAWQVRSPRIEPSDYMIATRDGKPVGERNMRRALEQAIERAKLPRRRRSGCRGTRCGTRQGPCS